MERPSKYFSSASSIVEGSGLLDYRMLVGQHSLRPDCTRKSSKECYVLVAKGHRPIRFVVSPSFIRYDVMVPTHCFSASVELARILHYRYRVLTASSSPVF